MSETHSLQCSQILLQNAALTLPLSLFRRLDFLWRQKTMLLRTCGLEASPAPALPRPFPCSFPRPLPWCPGAGCTQFPCLPPCLPYRPVFVGGESSAQNSLSSFSPPAVDVRPERFILVVKQTSPVKTF